MFDLTINIGNILQTLAMMVAVGAFIIRLQQRLHLDLRLLLQSHNQQKEDIIKIKSQIEQLNKLVVDLARQDQRLTNVETRMQELSNRLFEYSREKVS